MCACNWLSSRLPVISIHLWFGSDFHLMHALIHAWVNFLMHGMHAQLETIWYGSVAIGGEALTNWHACMHAERTKLRITLKYSEPLPCYQTSCKMRDLSQKTKTWNSRDEIMQFIANMHFAPMACYQHQPLHSEVLPLCWETSAYMRDVCKKKQPHISHMHAW